jgi:hypothetical protein
MAEEKTQKEIAEIIKYKIGEAKKALDEEEYLDALVALRAVDLYADKGKIDVPKEVEKLKVDAYKEVIKEKIDDADDALEDGEVSDAIAALLTAEKYSEGAGIDMPDKVKKLKQKAFLMGISTYLKSAKAAIDDGKYSDSLGPLNLVEKYSKELNKEVPAEVEILRKSAYKKGVEMKLAEAKESLKSGEYANAVGACAVIENMYAPKAGIPAPKEVSEIRDKAYHEGVKGKVRETKEALASGEFEDALSGIAGIEIYAKKAGIPVPDEIESLKKEAYTIASKSKLSEAAGLIEENDPEALTSIRVAIAYSKKAELSMPKEIETIMQKAYKVGMTGKISDAKEAIEQQEPQDALVALIVAERYAKEAGITIPAEVQKIRKDTYSKGMNVMLEKAKTSIKDGDYSDALGPLNLVEKYAKESGLEVPAEVETLRKNAYKKGVEVKLAAAKESLKEGEYSDAIGACAVIENMYSPKAGIPVPGEIAEIRDKAYQAGVKGKVKETKEALAEGEFEDALSGIAGIEIYAKKAGIPVPEEIESLKKEAYKTAVKGKISEAEELIEENDPDALTSVRVAIAYSKKAELQMPKALETLMSKAYKVGMSGKIRESQEAIEQEEPQDALVALIVAERYAKEAGITVPAEVEKIRREAYTKGMNVMLEKARTAINEGEYSDALGPLNLVEKYAKESKTKAPEEVEKLRKGAYKKGVETKLAEAKESLKSGEYSDAIGACAVIENMYAPKAGIPVPKEIAEIRDKAYHIGVSGKIRETKDALLEGEFEDALSGIAGIEIYAKKAGIPVPAEIDSLKKEAYTTASKSKISEAKELIEENDPDALAALRVAIAYSKKAELPLPKEIENLMPKAYKVSMNGKISEAKEAIDQGEPQDALVALIIAEKYAKEAGITAPKEVETLRKEAYAKGMGVMLERARNAITEGEYSDALGPLNLAEKYAKESKTKAPEEVEKLRRSAYKKGVETKLAEAKESLKNGEYSDAIGACAVIENMYAPKAGIPVPKEITEIRDKAYHIGVSGKIRETKDALSEGEFEDALSGIAGIEIYAKKAGIPVPAEIDSLRKEAYTTASKSKISEAKELIEENDPDALAALRVAIAYSKKAELPLPKEIENLMPNAYKVSMNGKTSEAKEAIEQGEPQDALVALIIAEKYAKEAGITAPKEVETIRKEAYAKGMGVMLERAKSAIKDGEYTDALGPLNLVEKYAKESNTKVPTEVDALRKSAYKKGVETKLAEATESVKNGEYADAIGACSVIENMYAPKAGIPVPMEIDEIRDKSYTAGVSGKIRETKDALSEGEFEDALSGIAGIEIYAKKAGIPVPAEIESLRKEAYTVASNSKISEAKELIGENDPDALASLRVAIAYSKKAGLPMPKEIEALMPEAYKVGMKGKISDAKESVDHEEPQDALVALIVADKYAKEAGITAPKEVETLRKEAYSKGMGVMLERAKSAIKDGEYTDALGPLNLVEKYAKESNTKVPTEVDALRKSAYKKGVETKLADAKEAVKHGEYADAIGACSVIESMYAPKAGIPVPGEIAEIRDKAYTAGVSGKIKETKDALLEGEFEDALSGIAGIEIYAKKAGIPVPAEIESLRKEAYTIASKSKISEAKELIDENDSDALASLRVAVAYSKKADLPLPKEIETLMPKAYKVGMVGKLNEAKEAIEQEEPQDALVALMVAERYANEAGVSVPPEAEKLRKEAYLKGIGVMVERARSAIKDGEYADALGPLNLAEKYAKESNTKVPEDVDTLRKSAYKKGVETKLADAKEAVKNGEYADAIGACAVIENMYAPKAGVSVPKEVLDIRDKAYRLGVTGKIKETEEALAKNEFEDALSGIAGIEIYSGKVGIPVPAEVNSLRKETYVIAAKNKISEAKEFIEENNPDALASLRVAIAYSKKADVPLPKEIETLMPKAYKVGMKGKIDDARDAIEQDEPQDALVALIVAERYAKEAGTHVPAEVETLRKEAFKKGVNVMLERARAAIKDGEYSDAIGPLNLVEKYAKESNTEVPAEVDKLRKSAYKKGVESKLSEAKEALKEGRGTDASGILNVVELYSKRAEVPVPGEVEDLRHNAYELSVNNKITEARESLNNRDYSDALGALAGVEVYAKRIGIPTPPEFEGMKNEAYHLAIDLNLKSASESKKDNNYADIESSINFVEMYAKKGGMDIPQKCVELRKFLEDAGYVKQKAKEAIGNSMEEARTALNSGSYDDALGALAVVEMHAKEVEIEVPAEVESMKQKAYRMAIETNLKTAKHAMAEGNYDSIPANLGLIEMYSKKAGIDVPSDVDEIRVKANEYVREKNIREIYNRINDAKSAISGKEYLDALGALNVSEYHAKNTNTPIPPEIDGLRHKAYELGVEVNMKNARESLEKKDYAQADLSLSLVQLYSKKIGVPVPAEVDEINSNLDDYRQDKMSKSLDAALQEVKETLSKGEHLDAIGSLNIVNMYVKKLGIDYPKETKTLMREAYELGMRNNIKEATNALDKGDVEQARIFTNIANMYARNANITYSPEINKLKEDISKKDESSDIAG